MAKSIETQEKTLTGKEIAVVEAASTGVRVGDQEYDIIKRVNLPTLKHDTGETVCVRMDDPIREVENIIEEEALVEGVLKRITRTNILHVVRVTELSSMQPFEYVLNAMTYDNMVGAYPDNSYVGRIFAIQKLGTVAGKRYKETNVVELAPRRT